MAKDLFSQLLPMKWRDVEFPTAGFRVSLHQDLVEHKYAERDGAHVEATGREPLVFTARAMFRNGITKGPTESFPGNLYPDVWRLFMAAAADRSTGILQHPELGQISCKLRRADTVWDAGIRDGVDVDVEWVETTDAGHEVLNAITSTSPITDITIAGKDLDASLSITRPLTPAEQKSATEPDFADTANSVTAIVDQASLLNRRVTGKLDQLTYRAQVLTDSLDRVADPKQWSTKRSAERLKSGVNDLKDRLFTTGKDVTVFVIPTDSTISKIANTLQRSTNSIILLNPSLLKKPVVPRGTLVRYYTNQRDDVAA